MPGILGVVQAEPEEAQSLSARMCHSMTHFEHYGVDTLRAHGFSGAVIGLRRAGANKAFSLVHDSTGVLVLFKGEILDCSVQQERRREHSAHSPDTREIEAIHSAYREYGGAFAEHLKGRFAIAIWDARQQTLWLASDRYGLCPLYYAETADGFAFAQEIKALLEVPSLCRDLDPVGIAEFLAFGYPLSDRTFFEPVKLLPPGSVLCVRHGAATVRRYWNFAFEQNVRERSEVQLIEEHADVLEQAINRCVRDAERFYISLSGGLDSRVIAAYLARRFGTIRTASYGRKHSHDQTIAARVAASIGADHHDHQLAPDYLTRSATETVFLLDGLQVLHHSHNFLSLFEEQPHADVRLNGYMGDPIHGSHLSAVRIAGSTMENGSSLAQAAGLIEKKHNSLVPLSLLGRMLSRRGGDNLVDRIRDDIRVCLSGSDPADHWRYHCERFDLNQRQRRLILNGPVLSGFLFDYRVPFADYDLVDFCLSLPLNHRWKESLYIKTFAHTFPQLAKIPWRETLRPFTPSLLGNSLGTARKLAHYAKVISLKRVPEKLTSGRAHVELARYSAHYDVWIRSALKTWLEDVFSAGLSATGGLLDQDLVKRFYHEHLIAKRDHTHAVFAIATVILWHNIFVDGSIERPTLPPVATNE